MGLSLILSMLTPEFHEVLAIQQSALEVYHAHVTQWSTTLPAGPLVLLGSHISVVIVSTIYMGQVPTNCRVCSCPQHLDLAFERSRRLLMALRIVLQVQAILMECISFQ